MRNTHDLRSELAIELQFLYTRRNRIETILRLLEEVVRRNQNQRLPGSEKKTRRKVA